MGRKVTRTSEYDVSYEYLFGRTVKRQQRARSQEPQRISSGGRAYSVKARIIDDLLSVYDPCQKRDVRDSVANDIRYLYPKIFLA